MPDVDDTRLPDLTRHEILKTLNVWIVVCTISAAPSFVMSLTMGSETPRILGMIAGVAIFIAGYTRAACMPYARRLRNIRIYRATLLTGYITRIAISIVFPVGLFLDTMCGIVSGGILGMTFQRTTPIDPVNNFGLTLLWTLMQGAILNLVLAVYMLLVYGVLRFTYPRPFKPVHEIHLCRKCMYDLRASRNQCPECGEPIPETIARVLDKMPMDPSTPMSAK